MTDTLTWLFLAAVLAAACGFMGWLFATQDEAADNE